MKQFKIKETFNITGRGTVHAVAWFENFESIVGTEVELDGKIYMVKEVGRNKCSAFYFDDIPWEKRDVWILV